MTPPSAVGIRRRDQKTGRVAREMPKRVDGRGSHSADGRVAQRVVADALDRRERPCAPITDPHCDAQVRGPGPE